MLVYSILHRRSWQSSGRWKFNHQPCACCVLWLKTVEIAWTITSGNFILSPEAVATWVVLDVLPTVALYFHSSTKPENVSSNFISLSSFLWHRKVQMIFFRSSLVQFLRDQEGELSAHWVLRHEALPERSGRSTREGRGFVWVMDSQWKAEIWQQVATVSGPARRLQLTVVQQPRESPKFCKHTSTWCSSPLLCMSRGVELQDVYREADSKRASGCGVTFPKNNLTK